MVGVRLDPGGLGGVLSENPFAHHKLESGPSWQGRHPWETVGTPSKRQSLFLNVAVQFYRTRCFLGNGWAVPGSAQAPSCRRGGQGPT